MERKKRTYARKANRPQDNRKEYDYFDREYDILEEDTDTYYLKPKWNRLDRDRFKNFNINITDFEDW